MKIITTNGEKLANTESTFTELFSLLKRYGSQEGKTTLMYTLDELKIIYQHTDNAIEVLLRGMCGIGHLMSRAMLDEKINEELNYLGLFISAISNLTEAVNDLKSDTDHVLKIRGAGSY